MFKQFFFYSDLYIYIILTKGKDFIMMIERYIDINIHVNSLSFFFKY